jgi:hypothetical protein
MEAFPIFIFTSTFETLAVMDFDLGMLVVDEACACVCKVAAHSGSLENFANEGVKTCNKTVHLTSHIISVIYTTVQLLSDSDINCNYPRVSRH